LASELVLESVVALEEVLVAELVLESVVESVVVAELVVELDPVLGVDNLDQERVGDSQCSHNHSLSIAGL